MSTIKDKISNLLTPYANEMEDERLGIFLTLSVGRVLLKNNETSINENDLRHITDWLKVAIINNEVWINNLDDNQRPKKLMKFNSIEGITQEANKAMHIANQKLSNIQLIEGDEELFTELEDGYYVVKLLTPAALDRESVQMQHCIGQGSYDWMLEDDAYSFLSLRDSAGNPHVTLEILGNTIRQCQGKQNEMPLIKYQRILLPFISDYKLDINSIIDFQYLLDDNTGTWHHIYELPDNLTVKRSLFFDETIERQITLPKNLTIEGDMNLSYTNIKYLPEGLKVLGDLWLVKTNIEIIPDDLYVKKILDLSETPIKHYKPGSNTPESLFLISCQNLESIEDNLHIKNVIYLDKSNALLKLPNNLKVDRHLSIVDTNITELPDDIVLNELVINNDKKIIIPVTINNETKVLIKNADHSSQKMKLKEYKELTNQSTEMTYSNYIEELKGAYK